MNTSQELVDMLNRTEGASAGHVIGWTLAGQVASYSIDAVHAAAAAVGLDGELPWPRLTPNQAYRRAVRGAFSGAADARAYEVVQVHEDEAFLAHAIVRRDIVRAPGLEFQTDVEAFTELRVGFDKRAARQKGVEVQSLFRTDTPRHTLVAPIRAMYVDLCTRYQHGDVRVAFQRAFTAWGGVRLINNGGCWWIPASADDKVRRWATFLQRLESTALVLPIHHTAEAIASLRALAEQNLEGQLQAVYADLQRFADSAKTKTKRTTLELRVAEFDALRERAELYERLLGNNLEDLKVQIAQAHDALVRGLATREGA